MTAWRNFALLALVSVTSWSACDTETHDQPANGGMRGSDAQQGAEPIATASDAAADEIDASESQSAMREAGVRDAVQRDGGAAGADAQTAGARDAATGASTGVPTLFFLDITGQRVLRADPNARTSTAVVTRGSDSPDGIAVDPIKGALYWTNMGVPEADDGFLMRADLNGMNSATLVPKAATFTPKQLWLDATDGLLYWSDREGMRVMRARIDGTNIETLITTGSGEAARADAANWAVGIAVDVEGGKLYWTQKGPDNGHTGSIRRAQLTAPAGEDAAHRSDIEILFAGLPEPIDLALDLTRRQIYWTDRGDNTISRAPMDRPADVAADKRSDRAILVRNAGEAIGIALDVAHDAMYFTSLEGTVSKAKLDGGAQTALLRDQGSLTGIAYVELPR